MKRQHRALGTAATIPIVVAVVAAGTAVYGMYTARQGPSSVPGIERSGPISSYPGSWTDGCGRSVQGNVTTYVSELPAGVNVTLSQVYSAIANSASFQNVSAGLGWVTVSWTWQVDSGPTGSHEYVTAQFVLLNASAPDGFVTAYYDIATGVVSVDYQEAPLYVC